MRLHARIGCFLVVAMVLPGWGADAFAAPAVSVDELSQQRQTLSGEFRLEGLVRDGAGETWLKLKPVPIFTPDAKLMIVDRGVSYEQSIPDIRHYHGHERDDAAAVAFVSVHHDGRVRGWLRRGAHVEAFGREPGQVAQTLSLTRVSLSDPESRREFSCGSDALGHVTPVPKSLATNESMSSVPEAALIPIQAARQVTAARGGDRWLGVAIDSDFEYYQRFNNTAAATAYTADLIGYTSLMYRNETNTGLLIPFLRLFTSAADPWSQSGDTACMLFEFGLHWHQQQGQVQRSTAHMLSGKNVGGGIAWLGRACATSNAQFDITSYECQGLAATGPYVGGYGVSADMVGDFNPANPQALWDIVVVSHELGHNLDSPHTHCYGGLGGNPNPVDQCYVEEGCYNGPVTLPGPQGQGSGTIMSYCHQRPGGLSNISLNFGTGHPYGVQPARVPNRIRSFVDQAPTSCFFDPEVNDAIFGNGFQCGDGAPGCGGGGPACLSSQGATANGLWFSGDPNNRVRNLNIGAGNQLTGMAVDVRVQAVSPSWLSEAKVLFSATTPTVSNPGISYTPGLNMQQSGTIDHSSNGVFSFAPAGLTNVVADPDGILRVEWHESLDDPQVNPDSIWSNHPTPTVCPGFRLICTNQAACDAAVQGQ